MPDSKGLDSLIKTDSSPDINLANSKKYLATKNRIKQICRGLSIESSRYRPEKTVADINNYIKTKDKLVRILYSEISNYLFELEQQKKESFLTNVESLLMYALGDSSLHPDVAKIIVKIYDHTQLVNYQIVSMNKIFAKNIVDAKENLNQQIKGIEKEYITILGIFASIVLAFVGSFTFSTSVLSNITKDNIMELIVIALIVGMIFFNLIAYLIDFLRDINDKVIRDANGRKIIGSYIKTVNAILVGLVVAAIIALCATKIKLPEKIYIGVAQQTEELPKTDIENNGIE